jgi:hypothetical protein
LQYNHTPKGRSERARANAKYNRKPEVRIAHNLRSRLRLALRNDQKVGSAIRDLGCTIPELRIYLEGQFQPGMTWDNYGEWHIDHKEALAKFDLSDRTQLLKACHFTNLQPLWAASNFSKGAT